MPRRLIILLFILCGWVNLSAQELDSLLALERFRPTHSSFSKLVSLQDSFVEMAPKLMQAQRQIQSRRNLLAYQDLGTHFSPIFNIGELHTPKAGFVSGNYALNPYINDFKSRKYYNASMPFTSFRYAQGGQQYIQFDALHTQNIIPTWNVAAGIQSFTNKGYGLRRLQVHRAPFVTSHFTWPNNRFRILTSLNWTRRSGYVNGGLSSRDSVPIALNKDTSNYAYSDAYNLISPGVDRNSLITGLAEGVDTVKFTNHTFRFQYHLGTKYMDTLDSISKVQPVFGLFYQLGYEKETRLYNQGGEDSTFFRALYPSGSISNRDSQVFRLLRNEFGFEKYKLAQNGLGFETHLGLEQGSYTQNASINQDILNTYVGGRIQTLLANRVGFSANGNFYLSGYNQGDYRVEAVGAIYTPWAELRGGLVSQLYEPAPVNRYFVNPNFTYLKSGLQKVLSNQIIVELNQSNVKRPIRLIGKVHNLNNYVYYDQEAKPVQSNTAIQHVQLQLQKRIQWKHMNLDVNGFLQTLNSTVMDLPLWAIKTDLFYQNYHADSAIHLKTGLDLHYNATYKASGYLPMLRQFYFANNNTLGGYPLLDAYVSGDVKSLTFFLKMENILNSVYVQRDVVRSYSTEVYPIQPMAFRLGLLWDFYY